MEGCLASSQQAMFLPSSHVHTEGEGGAYGNLPGPRVYSAGTFHASAQYCYEITDFYRFSGFQSNAGIILFNAQIFPS